MAQEKFNLQWNDFQENAKTTFHDLADDKDFTDVTLASEEGNQFTAHKVILAASSPFFRNTLKKNQHSHPLMYMHNIASDDLTALLNFIYRGEVQIVQENLARFLGLADQLKIKGLEGAGSGHSSDSEKSKNKIKEEGLPDTKVSDRALDYTNDEDQHILVDIPDSEEMGFEIDDKRNISHFDLKTVEADTDNLEEQINTMLVKVDGGWACTMCGKIEKHSRRNLIRHIEGKHLKGVSVFCPLCDDTFGSRNALYIHTSSMHPKKSENTN